MITSPAKNARIISPFHQVAHAPRGVARRGDCSNAHVPERDRFIPFESEIHMGRVRFLIGHVKGAEQRFARSAGREYRDVALARVNLGPCGKPQSLGSSCMVTVHVRKQDGAHPLPVEPQFCHFGFQSACIFFEPGVDENQAWRGVDRRKRPKARDRRSCKASVQPERSSERAAVRGPSRMTCRSSLESTTIRRGQEAQARRHSWR